MSDIIYDEVSEFFIDRKVVPNLETSAFENLKQAIMKTGRQFDKTKDELRKSLHAVDYFAMDFNHTYIISPAEMERQKRRERFLAQRAACLHGERLFRIRWSDEALTSIGGHL